MQKLIYLKTVSNIVSLILLSAGCGVNDSQPVFLNTYLIGKGTSTGNDQIPQQNIVISDSGSWYQLINRMDSIVNITGSFTETEIDFEQYLVIAAIDSGRTSSGYEIEIKSILEIPANIIVNIENKSPHGGVLAVETKPYHIVKIPRTDKQIVFN